MKFPYFFVLMVSKSNHDCNHDYTLCNRNRNRLHSLVAVIVIVIVIEKGPSNRNRNRLHSLSNRPMSALRINYNGLR